MRASFALLPGGIAAPADFAAQLRARRRAAGLTQEALAERAGLSVRGISDLERGLKAPQRATVDLLVRALALSPAAARQFAQAAQRRRARMDDGAGAARPAASSLPAPLTSFIGRERELGEVARLLERSRLVTLTGAGGVGKTRLALEAAAGLLDAFADGVWFVDLAPLADAALVPQVVAAAIGVPEVPGCPLLRTLVDSLRDRELLLLVDNCEHLLDASAHLAETLLRACPNLRLLATSRERLGLAGETVLRVPSLTVPGADRTVVSAGIAQSEAVQLFLDRARAALPNFAAGAESAPVVAQLCARLDGIPLAIELAAARVRVLTVEQIVERLDDRFRLLTGGSRTALPRQRTLQATVDWSFELLTGQERALLRRLAVFAGGWTLEAAEAVGAGEDIAAPDILELLSALADKSLVVAESRGAHERYRLLETIRQYAAAKLVAAGEMGPVRDRHRDWYAALAERADSEVAGGEQPAWYDRLEAEHDNLRAALAWSLESDPAVAVRLAGSLRRFWTHRRHHAEGRRWAEAVLARASPAAGQADRRARARLLLCAGVLAAEQSAARAFIEESLRLFRAVGDQRGLARALQGQGELLLFGGGPAEQVQAALEESLDVARAAGDRRSVALALQDVGYLAARDGDDPRARRLIDEALALWRQIDDAHEVSDTLAARGWFAWGRGEFPQARRDLEEGLEIARRLGHRWGAGVALLGLACLTHEAGDGDRVRALLEESAQLLQETDAPWVLQLGLAQLGHLAICQGRYASGIRLLAMVDAASPDGREFNTIFSFLQPSTRPAARAAALGAARAAVSEEAFSTAWAQGRAMTVGQAFDAALGDDGDA